jgi:fructuronate reductase
MARAAPGVRRPGYVRTAIQDGIVHLGIGAFHRAHQAVYVDDVLAAGDHRWGIVGVSLRGTDTRDALAPQDGLYTLLVRGNGAPARIIGSVREVLFAPAEIEPVLARMSAPSTSIVSLTITEKGYCHSPATGELDENHPQIIADLANPAAPQTALGFLAEALRRRRAAGIAPFTVLTCDNLPANGETLHRVLSRYATLLSPDFGSFVANEVATPSTMIDRIVPATTDIDREAAAEAIGLEDAWPIVTEPFSQWVIEDRFPAGRPSFETVGAEFVSDVAPYEKMKLRMLNGAHSSLAYLGTLAGLEFVSQAVADVGLSAFAAMLMRDAAETLTTPSATREAYALALMNRFQNPTLRHRLIQIAMDGTQKLPQRLLGTVRDRLAAGKPIARHALAVAAWMRFVSRRDATGAPIRANDPLADQLVAAVSAASDEAIVRNLLALKSVFGDDLPAAPRFVGPVTTAFEQLSPATIHRMVAEAVA